MLEFKNVNSFLAIAETVTGYVVAERNPFSEKHPYRNLTFCSSSRSAVTKVLLDKMLLFKETVCTKTELDNYERELKFLRNSIYPS